MSIISQDNLTPTQRPIVPKIQYEASVSQITPVYNNGTASPSGQSMIPNIEVVQEGISDNATTPSRVGSPTSISNLLQMALGPHGIGEVMQTSTVKEDGTISFVGNRNLFKE